MSLEASVVFSASAYKGMLQVPGRLTTMIPLSQKNISYQTDV